MIYIDDKLPRHRKILRAGEIVTDALGGRAAALGTFVAAVGYAREHFTDGIVPGEFVHDFARNRTVVDALCSVHLMRRLRGNRYEIHDFLDWNKSAEKIKKDRVKNAIRQRAHRDRKGTVTPLSRRDRTPRNASVTRAPDPRSPIPDPLTPGTPPDGGAGPPVFRQAPLHVTHKKHAHCGRVCLHAALFDEFVRRRNHEYADQEIRDWALQVEREWGDGGPRQHDEPGDAFDFWRARYAEQWPPLRVVATGTNGHGRTGVTPGEFDGFEER